jgi:class 3 adenylate cyclase
MLEYGAEVSIVLPYNYDEFVEDSVAFVPESNWRARFDHVLKRAARVLTASTQRIEMSGVSYEFCNQMLLGLASIRALQLDTELVPLAVWNGKSGDGPGGAATVVENWRSLGLKPVIVDLPMPGDVPSRSRNVIEARSETTMQSPSNKFSSRIVAVLFADAVGFSKLTEREVPRFVEHFFGAIAKLSDNFRDTILVKNTWGDGLYYVFSDVLSAGSFALELASVITETKWEDKGLRPNLTMRIGLHAGPVYEFDDPITGHRTYSGTHVSQAARIEPITPPGQVYASEAFAALAAAHRVKNFTCDYVGQTPLAKDYGTLPTYHVRAKPCSEKD